ncbi:MAG TPA: YaeQ family protein [Arcobacter sp.]|nr:YaeQ family protein [Arcobacter sp.]HIP55833.1 YaeQ family protein [Arcobacter sp.]
MAANATIHKAYINIANMDKNYYEEHNLTLAQHPSENDLRLIIRLVSFVLNATDTLMFCKGISADDEPTLWQKSLGGDIEMWIDLGQPDEKRIKKACGRSDKVIIYTFKENVSSTWFNQIKNSLNRFNNLQIIYLNINGNIEELCKRSMNIQCNISDNELTLIDENNSVVITQEIYKEYS